MSAEYGYKGLELELFESAKNWKRYLVRAVRPYLKGHVLEVGAGIGGFTKAVWSKNVPGENARIQIDSWLCLEPNAKLTATIQDDIDHGLLPEICTAKVGTLDSLSGHQTFDTILYIDVLEHIKDDRAEMANSVAQLTPGGKLIVLVPAHEWLFSELDRVVGHHRRYTADSLVSLTPPHMRLVSCCYYDCIGIAASLANRLLLRQGVPTPAQISVWDRFMVPLSRRIDPLIGHRFGKSVLAIWEKET